MNTPLPAGWNSYVDPAGRIYYHDTSTGVTQWNPPSVNPPIAVSTSRPKKSGFLQNISNFIQTANQQAIQQRQQQQLLLQQNPALARQIIANNRRQSFAL
ncbi:hypothetical protein C1645_815967 [Glomus cerebriforme]|uniref:WW domain-containing protein n=1 Tax=Glomus cerebriforme TaxID=658196 RepID=A0A397THQ7_9GLOM|nr:hypothetical protein C1645_815967 [Glomus cerebriforme]